MPRARSPNRYKAFSIWKDSKGKKKNKDIAAELGVSEKLISRWRKEDKWEEKFAAQKGKKSTNPKSRKMHRGKKIFEEDTRTGITLAKAINENEELTENQRLFLLYWMKDRNATQAYFRTHHCTYETAMAEGCKTLRNPKIKKEIMKLKGIRNETLLLDQEDIIEKYMKIAFADITDFMVIKNNKVCIVNSNMMDGGLVSEVKQTKFGIGIKLDDRMKALQWLSDYFMMNPMDQHKRSYDEKILVLKERDITNKEW